jgi:hypothetical protein
MGLRERVLVLVLRGCAGHGGDLLAWLSVSRVGDVGVSSAHVVRIMSRAWLRMVAVLVIGGRHGRRRVPRSGGQVRVRMRMRVTLRGGVGIEPEQLSMAAGGGRGSRSTGWA